MCGEVAKICPVVGEKGRDQTMSVDCATLHDDKAALGDISNRLAELFDTFFKLASTQRELAS